MISARKKISLRVASLVAIPAVIATLGGVSVSAQEQPSANSSEPTGENKCAAVHLVLVNGTFDTSAGESSTMNHGFEAQIACKAMRKANEIPPADPSAGISLEKPPEPVSTQTDHGQAETDDIWGQASVAS